MGKKAGLSLSLEAIIMVILSAIVLALAVVFIRGVFTNMSTTVKEAVDAHELVNPPTTDTPVTLTPPEQTIKQGKMGKTTLAFLNILPDTVNCNLVNSVETAASKPPQMLYSTKCMKMNKEQINSWVVVISAPEDASPSTSIFTMQINCFKTEDCSGTTEGTFSKDLAVFVKE